MRFPRPTAFSGRYVFDKAYNLSPLTGFFGAALPLWPEVDHSKNQFFTAEERHIFSSNVVNNLRFMFIRTFESSFSGEIAHCLPPRIL